MKCHRTLAVLIILLALTKVSFESPVANPKAEPCLAFIFGLLSSMFGGFSFGGYGGPLGPTFVGGYPGYYPGMYYGAPYYPYPYPYYPPYYQGPGPVFPGGPVIVNPGGPVFPGGPVIVNPGGPIIVNPTPTTRQPIIIGK